MPRLLIFANGMHSRGDGFVKYPFSGMWQCTLPSGTPVKERCEQKAPSSAPAADEASSALQLTTPNGSQLGACEVVRAESQTPTQQQMVKREEAVSLHLRPLFLPLHFQLISVSSKYLCSILFAARPHPLSEVHVVRLRKITSGRKLCEVMGIAFASTSGATWADVLSFVRRSPVSCLSAEMSQTVVWRLNCLAPAGSGVNVGAGFFGRVTGLFSLHSPVKEAFGEGEEETLHVVLATSKEGAVCTPPDRVVSGCKEPPPLPPKQTHREKLPYELPQRNLSAAFIEAQEEEEKVTTAGSKEDTANFSAGSECALEKKEPQPTYAEVLTWGIRRQNSGVNSTEALVREWRRRLIALRKEIFSSLCNDTAIIAARNQILQLQKEKKQECHLYCARSIAILLKAGLQEVLCDVLFDVATFLMLGGQKQRSVHRLLQECITTAQATGEELEKRRVDVAAALRLPYGILRLRLLRHHCCAAHLMGEPVQRVMLEEALRVNKGVMALLLGNWAGAICPEVRSTVGGHGDGDASVEQLVSGALTAALSLLEMSFLAKGATLCDEMTSAAGSLLLWLRDTSGGRFEIPVALAARLEERVAEFPNGELDGMLRWCNLPPAVQVKKLCRHVEFCCGVVRAVSSGVLFDYQFARTRALLRGREAALPNAASDVS
ncbi:hypothetical protein C3747_344g29 [Trypanosoma cruzi]|uniref:Uncharacterized protein n=2 Tax=Trypanosoma cruzi TaxID=5693 RepID=Q4DUW9_TRYCC|nr:hypothetical protein, conserved [Trypanosoma cruzi]EAN96317.1 hypothetical protein, conserved [Trypanosoma cruzi]PWU91197.1 hypothetical protein C3747_344g29 [Trypanosoma cruzi]RNC58505.1 hypothetical protein TcCL_ESM03867 [Trypanosoma cruzi]|eukprot:XP_818168.1 hypothetical protein [Trypanosoma cruzi strain CL Brener]